MDIWDYFERLLKKWGSRAAQKWGPWGTYLTMKWDPRVFSSLASHPKVGTQSFYQFPSVRYSLAYPFFLPGVPRAAFVCPGKCYYCFFQNPDLARVEEKRGNVEKKQANAYPLSHSRLLSWNRIQLGLRRALSSLQKWTEFAKCIHF